MMKEDNLEQLFKDLNGQFDVETPNQNHQARFLEKLNTIDGLAENESKANKGFNWKPFLAIAASIVICLSIVLNVNNSTEPLDLASVSPEMSEAQDFFTATIEKELKTIQNEDSPYTKKLISDALEQIKSLEDDYNNLKIDLTESGNDQRVIYAMIGNFQSRIDILNTVIEEINKIKQLKAQTNETTNTL